MSALNGKPSRNLEWRGLVVENKQGICWRTGVQVTDIQENHVRVGEVAVLDQKLSGINKCSQARHLSFSVRLYRYLKFGVTQFKFFRA